MILNKSSRRILKKRSSKRRKSRKRRNRRIKISGGASSLKGAKWTKGWINGQLQYTVTEKDSIRKKAKNLKFHPYSNGSIVAFYYYDDDTNFKGAVGIIMKSFPAKSLYSVDIGFLSPSRPITVKYKRVVNVRLSDGFHHEKVSFINEINNIGVFQRRNDVGWNPKVGQKRDWRTINPPLSPFCTF